MTRAEKHRLVTTMKSSGMTHAQVASELHMSANGIRNIINDPDGSKQKARRERYRGTCEDCGKKTDGSSGYNAPTLCISCSGRRSKVWTKEAVIDAIQQWATGHGRPPTAADWRHADTGRHPAVTSVYRSTTTNPYAVFRYWADAIEAAGFPRPLTGHYQVAKRVHWTRETVITLIQRWAEDNGRPPTRRDWIPATTEHPHPQTVVYIFGSWASGVEEAGFPRPRKGRRVA